MERLNGGGKVRGVALQPGAQTSILLQASMGGCIGQRVQNIMTSVLSSG